MSTYNPWKSPLIRIDSIEWDSATSIFKQSPIQMIHFTDHYEDWDTESSNLGQGQLLCSHEPCENGFRRTWCKRCNVDMISVDGVYVEVEKAKEEKQG